MPGAQFVERHTREMADNRKSLTKVGAALDVSESETSTVLEGGKSNILEKRCGRILDLHLRLGTSVHQWCMCVPRAKREAYPDALFKVFNWLITFQNSAMN